MQALAFWKAVTEDRVGLLDRIFELLDSHGIRYCVIGGQGVNAFVEPVVSLDLDLALAAEDQARIEALLTAPLVVRRFLHSLVLGRELPVAAVDDILRGKVWAAQDPERRASKRQKDLADIARLIESFPQLRAQLPADVLAKLL